MGRLRHMRDSHFVRALDCVLVGILVLCVFIATPSVVMAGTPGADDLDSLQKADDEMLNVMRGGFLSAGGLEINFSIERAVLVDGELVSRTVIDLSQPSQVNGQTASGPSILPEGIMTVVQNALDLKVITNLNIINVEIANLRSIAADALGVMLTNQIVYAVR